MGPARITDQPIDLSSASRAHLHTACVQADAVHMRIIPQQNQIAASRVSCRRRRQTANGGHLKIKMASGGGAPTTILKKQPPTVESLSLSTTTKIHFTTQYKDCLTNLRSLCFVLTNVFVAIIQPTLGMVIYHEIDL